MPASVLPFLMFQGDAEAALNLYLSVFPDAKVLDTTRYKEGEEGTAGALKLATFLVAGQSVRCFDSPVNHAFTFTPSFSFFVDCESEEELRRLAAGLGEGGGVMMAPDNYGFSRLFTWISDRFGVSWQLNLP